MNRAKRSGGRIDITELIVPPQKHELKTAHYFAERGYIVKFIRPSNIPEMHRPDFSINGIEWETKAPTGKGKRTIKHNVEDALAQSVNIIIDLRRCGLPESVAISQLEWFYNNKRIRRLMVITKSQGLLEYPENCLDK